MVLTKTVEESDYELEEMKIITNSLKDSLEKLTTAGIHIELGHPHRFWEYGMASFALDNLFHQLDQPSIVDVGAGDGLLMPSLSLVGFDDLTEIEPNTSCHYRREICNSFLESNLRSRINWQPKFIDNKTYDVVFCISVIEHVPDDHNFLRSLAERINKNGILFLTTDVVPVMPPAPPKTGYHFDNLREHNYTMFDICKKIDYLNSIGFELLGESDLTYKGDKVFDYSFASICMTKVK